MLNKLKIANVSGRRKDLFACAFLVLLPPIFFWRQTIGSLTLADKDATFWYLPVWKLAVEQLKAGQFPLWNPYLFSGTALFAQWQPGLLDPLNWLHIAGPSSQTLTAAQELSFVIALLGTFGFARRIGMGRRAAVTSAVVFAFSGFLVARTVYPAALHVAVLIPVLLWFIERLSQTGRWREVVFGSLVVAWQIFAAHPQPFVYSFLLVSSYAIFLSLPRSAVTHDGSQRFTQRIWHWLGKVRFRFLLQCAVIFPLGVTLAAVQLLPAWEVASQSVRRDVPYEFFTWNSLHPLSLLTALFPFFHGEGNSIYHVPYWGSYWSHNEGQFYLGLVAIALAVASAIGLWHERRRMVAFWAIVAVLAALCALGRYVAPMAWLLYQVPLVGNFRSPNRHWMEVTLAVAILSGFAVDSMLRSKPRAVELSSQATAGLLTLLCTIVGTYAIWRTNSFEAFIRSLPDMNFLPPGFLRLRGAEFYMPMIAAACLLLILVVFVRTRHRARWYPLLLGALLADYQLYAVFAPISSQSHLESMMGRALPPELAGRQSEFEPIRYHLLQKPNEGAFNPFWFYGHEMATGYDPLMSERYRTLSGINEAGRSDRLSILGARDQTLDLLNVRFVLVPPGVLATVSSEDVRTQAAPLKSTSTDLGDTNRWNETPMQEEVPGYPGLRAFENLRALPRAWLVPEVEVMTDPQQLDSIRGDTTEKTFDPYAVALIEPALASRLADSFRMPSDGTFAADSRKVRIVRRTSQAMTLATEASQPAILVMSEVDYPGWRATVDGSPVELFRVNYLLRGVALTAGRHTVELAYWPRSLTIGAIISLSAAIFSIGLCWLCRGARP